jgi:hypothetical protein
MRPFLVSLSAVAIACSGTDATDPPVTPQPLPVSSIVLEVPASMVIGTSATIKVSLRDLKGREVKRPLTFASSDNSIATVDPGGIITAIKEGSASISVTSEGQSAEAVVYAVRPMSTTCRDGFDFCALNVYDLVSVNGQPLPVKSPWGVGEWDYDTDAGTWALTHAAMVFYKDGIFMYSMAHHAASGRPLYEGTPGTYENRGPFYLLTGSRGGAWEAHINADILTVEWVSGMTFTFKARYPD